MIVGTVVDITSPKFKANARTALLNETLQAALKKSRGGFVDKRRVAIDDLPQFEELRDRAVDIKNHVLTHLDQYLEQFTNQVEAAGGHVHFASTAAEGVDTVIDICKQAGATRIAKGKSMIGEEMDLNEALEREGMEVIETDLGEYIIQLAQEKPSHIIAPAVHKTRTEISDLFHQHHGKYGLTERVEEVATIVNEARMVLREHFVSADVGITGANFLLADSGASVLVTNEGNGDLCSTLPRVHIVTASIEKIIPTQKDLSVFLRLLARSATGQEISSYTSIYSGPAHAGDMDGPTEYHVVLLDNGRSTMLQGEFWEMLRCIRCGACMNHCPVYQSIGGHAYGWIYPGPMGSVWTPLLVGLQNAANLPNACTLNGRCETVCPIKIPLPRLLRRLRNQIFERGLADWSSRVGLSMWSVITRHPKLYRRSIGVAAWFLHRLGRNRGLIQRLPLSKGWTESRDLPSPSGKGFVTSWNTSKNHRQ